MLKIGLTGGIASGKSTVGQLFSKIDIPVIDADIIARELVQPDMPALTEITSTFGQKILQKNGQLDRSHLRQLIFSDQHSKQQLENILHPKIRLELEQRIQSITSSPYCILSIPLLIESKMFDLVDRILVINTNEAEQIKRLCLRDQISQVDVSAIIASQSSMETRMAYADDIINNDGEPERLIDLVQTLHKKYLKLAQSK